jgi:hypothetical protein
VDTFIYDLVSDVLWNALPGELRLPRTPGMVDTFSVLDLVSEFACFYQVYWQPLMMLFSYSRTGLS